MDVELREALTHGFGPEPPHRAVSELVEAGHRAVRRRRPAASLVTVAAAGVLGSGAVVVLGGDPGTPALVADDPTTAPTPDQQEPWIGGGLARYSDTGQLEFRPRRHRARAHRRSLGATSDDYHSVALSSTTTARCTG